MIRRQVGYRLVSDFFPQFMQQEEQALVEATAAEQEARILFEQEYDYGRAFLVRRRYQSARTQTHHFADLACCLRALTRWIMDLQDAHRVPSKDDIYERVLRYAWFYAPHVGSNTVDEIVDTIIALFRQEGGHDDDTEADAR